MVVLFKFEEEFYQNAGVNVDFSGHPLLDIVKPSMEKKNFWQNLTFLILKPLSHYYQVPAIQK